MCSPQEYILNRSIFRYGSIIMILDTLEAVVTERTLRVRCACSDSYLGLWLSSEYSREPQEMSSAHEYIPTCVIFRYGSIMTIFDMFEAVTAAKMLRVQCACQDFYVDLYLVSECRRE